MTKAASHILRHLQLFLLLTWVEGGTPPKEVNDGTQLQYGSSYDDVSFRHGLSQDFVFNSNGIVHTVPDDGLHYQGTRPRRSSWEPDAPYSIPIFLEAGSTYRFEVNSELDLRARLFLGGLTNTEIISTNKVQRALSSRTGSIQELVQGALWWEDRYESFETQDGDQMFTIVPEVSQTYTLYVYRAVSHLGTQSSVGDPGPSECPECTFFVSVDKED